MAVLWILEWDGITREVFAEIKARTDWEAEAPAGLQHQVSAFSNKSLVLAQVWQSPDHVLRFMEDRLLPAIKSMGINSMPKVDQYPIEAIFDVGPKT